MRKGKKIEAVNKEKKNIDPEKQKMKKQKMKMKKQRIPKEMTSLDLFAPKGYIQEHRKTII